MPSGLKRYQETRDVHFVTFTCYDWAPNLQTPTCRDLFEEMLEQTRRLYGFYVSAYVVMPEHVHLLVSEPKRRLLATALQALKQAVSRRALALPTLAKAARVGHPHAPFWQARYYDRNIWSSKAFEETRSYIHTNPVRRGLVEHSEDWAWSSARHYVTSEKRVVEVESQWTARERERAGIDVEVKFMLPHPSKGG